ncbi:MAG: CvpA family protein [Bacteroidetes bacterium]|nr:CvpA family protein [Bacteroidota bacterium]
MNKLDILIVVLIAIPALIGLSKGFLRKVFSLVSLILGLYLATKFNTELTTFIMKFSGMSLKTSNILSFVVIIMGIYTLGIYIAKKISNINSLTKSVDKTLGLFIGIIQGMIIASLCVIAVNNFDLVNKETINNSKLYVFVNDFAPRTFNTIASFLPNYKSFYEEIKSLTK